MEENWLAAVEDVAEKSLMASGEFTAEQRHAIAEAVADAVREYHRLYMERLKAIGKEHRRRAEEKRAGNL